MKRCLLTLLLICGLSLRVLAQQTGKPVSRDVLIHYISKAVHLAALNDFCKTADGLYPGSADSTARIVDEYEMYQVPVDPRVVYKQADMRTGKLFLRYMDMLRLIRNVKPKLITDALTQWGGGTAWPPWQMDWQVYLNRSRHVVNDIKAIDSDIVIQASINEFVDPPLLNAIGEIPAWVFIEFGLPVEHRKFDIKSIAFTDYQTNNGHNWGYGNGIVPDISRIETQMYFYYMAVSYINLGCESLEFCQVELMDNQTVDPTHWGSLFSRVRKYADSRANIRFLLITGGTQGMRYPDGQLIFDFNTAPIRPSENGYDLNENGGGCYIDEIQCWEGRGKLYKSSLGGTTPSGWYCDELPGLVLFDNNGPDPKVGGRPAGRGCNQYHWDEITWYALQDRSYRNNWLRYANDRIRYLDSNIYLAPTITTVIVCSTNEISTVDYMANNPSADSTLFPVPKTIDDRPGGLIDRNRVQMYAGYGQEDVIKELMADAGKGKKYTATVSSYPNPVSEKLFFSITATGFTSLRLHCDVINTMGQKVLKIGLPDTPNPQIDVSHLCAGLYFVTVSDEEEHVIYGATICKK